VLDLLLPSRCALCGSVGIGLCRSCAHSLPPAPRRAPPPGLTHSWGLVAYADAGKALVAAIKFRRHRDALGVLGRAMAMLVEVEPTVVTWAPTTAQRARARGGDQAELLAVAVARELGRPCRALLGRVPGRQQTGLGRADRLDGVEFLATGGLSDARDHVVLVVDDVRTTGATLCAASDALLGSGVATTCALTLAVTP